jgi:adenylyl-sulfate kinase
LVSTVGHPDLSNDLPARPAARLRIAICGAAGAGRRTLLAALSEAPRAIDVVDASRDDVGPFALELLDGPPVRCGVILIDATAGVTAVNRRDARLLTALGVLQLVVAINKMDLVEFSAERFAELEAEVRSFAVRAPAVRVTCVPVCALHGDNVLEASPRLRFTHDGPLIDQLERFRVEGPPPPAAEDPTLAAADIFQVTVAWSAGEPMLRGRAYEIELGGQHATATVAPLKHRFDIDSGERLAAVQLQAGEIGSCVLELSDQLRFAPHEERPEAGTFVLLDRIDGRKVGIGTIEFALRRSQNVRWQSVTVDKELRCAALGQQPAVLWLTGLSGAGKSTIANIVEAELHRRGHHTYLLDGDNVRHGLNADLGFSAADRVENIRRVGEVARLMVDAGLIVIVSFISPFRAERRMARSLVADDEFFEVFVDTPLEVAEQRDPKGLYGKARRGELTNFTGISSPYEPPEHPEIRVDTTVASPAQAALEVVELLERAGRLTAPLSPVADLRR